MLSRVPGWSPHSGNGCWTHAKKMEECEWTGGLPFLPSCSSSPDGHGRDSLSGTQRLPHSHPYKAERNSAWFQRHLNCFIIVTIHYLGISKEQMLKSVELPGWQCWLNKSMLHDIQKTTQTWRHKESCKCHNLGSCQSEKRCMSFTLVTKTKQDLPWSHCRETRLNAPQMRVQMLN